MARIIASLAAIVCAAVPLGAQLPDSMSVSLDEIVVERVAARRLFSPSGSGSTTITSDAMRQMPQMMGNADPVRAMQALPAVLSGGDVGGGLFVEGCDAAQNAVSINGHRVYNPMHMLGLFSVFNSPHFSEFELSTASPASGPDVVGAILDARTPAARDTVLGLEATVGLIDSHATVRLPLGRSSLRLSGRVTYVDLLFGNTIRLEHSDLHYGFDDWNATWTWQPDRKWTLKTDLALSRDRFTIDDRLYDADGHFAWQNITAGVSATGGPWTIRAGYSRFANRFDLVQGGTTIELPSALASVDAAGRYDAKVGPGHLTVGADITLTRVYPQYDRRKHPDGSAPDGAGTFATFGEYSIDVPRVARFTAGLRLALFSGKVFSRLYPLPRVAVERSFAPWLAASLSWGMHMQPLHRLRQSDVGLPTDYFVNASERFCPQVAMATNLQLSGRIAAGWAYSLTLYHRRMSYITEYNGAILNVVNSDYDPLDDLLSGSGRTYGLAVSVMKNVGRVTGIASYTLSRSEGRFDELGPGWFPLAHDRRHDLSVSVAWRPHRNWTFSATGIWASGLPYTKAAYGYMIGENLICEYYPHNSSRLPDYDRLDLAAQWTFLRRKGREHTLSVSLYNTLCRENTIFRYVTYSTEEGVRHQNSSMHMILPCLSYTFRL